MHSFQLPTTRVLPSRSISTLVASSGLMLRSPEIRCDSSTDGATATGAVGTVAAVSSWMPLRIQICEYELCLLGSICAKYLRATASLRELHAATYARTTKL